jgi:hypothetical protein
MMSCGADIRQFGLESGCIQESSVKIVEYLHSRLLTSDGEPATSVVQLYKTLRFDELDDVSRRFALTNFECNHDSIFVMKMASAGFPHELNARRTQHSEQVIPINDPRMLRNEMPIVAQLISQLELGEGWPREEAEIREYLIDQEQRRFNVLFIPDVRDCPYQSMLSELGIRSVIAYGGMLNRNSAFCVLMLTKISISKESAELFSPLALSTKNALVCATDFRPYVPRVQPA